MDISPKETCKQPKGILKMLNITNYQRNANEKHMIYIHLIPVRVAYYF